MKSPVVAQKHMNIKINGKNTRQYTHNGNVYIEGREGTEYTIRLQNDHYNRRLFVISIDGVNAVSGKNASEDTHNGYIINAFDSLDLKGFRINDNDVASFKFVKADQSYAKTTTGDSINCGVIGVKIYDELVPQVTFTTSIMGTTNAVYYRGPQDCAGNWPSTCGGTTGHLGSACSDSASLGVNYCQTDFGNVKSSLEAAYTSSVSEPVPDFNLGTGWGSKQTQSVKEVEFKVGALILTEMVYYASKAQLEKMGIDLVPKPTVRSLPSAFGEKKYCPIPPNWKG